MRQELNPVLSQLDTNHIYPVTPWIKVSSLSRTCQIVVFFAKAQVKHADRKQDAASQLIGDTLPLSEAATLSFCSA